MKRRSFIKLSSFLLVNSFLPKTTIAGNAKQQHALIMGVFPRRNIKLTYQIFTPMAQYLSDTLNVDIKLVTAKNFKLFWQGVKEQRYDLVHYNQYHYIISNLLYNYQVILKNQEFNNNTVSSSIIVRKDSGYEAISDLKNKTILFGGGKMAMQSYIAARWLLNQGGLPHGSYIEKFAVNPPNAIMSTFYKQADAAGAGDVVLRQAMVIKNIDITKMDILAKTWPLPHLPWAVKNDMTPLLQEKIQSILSSLNTHTEGRDILSEAKLSALEPATDNEYDRHRKIISDIYGKDYGIDRFR